MIAGWGDMDFNSHMRNTAYLDRSADIRMMFFSENGFPMSEFMHRRIGPVVKTDAIQYFREITLLEQFEASLAIAGLSENGSSFEFRNEFRRADGKLAVTVTSSGGWLDLSRRKLVAPPQALLSVLQSLHRTEDFRVLKPSAG